jgi:thioredoxin reductase
MRVRTNEKVESVVRGPDGLFTVKSQKQSYRARTVVLALGRRGTPRKLGIPGEQLPKVMYGLIETEAYTQSRILVVGGGDSAIEAAMGLAHQKGNKVTLSYRRDAFSRLKERNEKRIQECIRKGMIEVLYTSNPVEVRAKSVVIEVKGQTREIANDWVWIFAGGTPPTELLASAGITLGQRDLTREAHEEARRAGKAA